ncbi:Spx/MgsR family RNA polymerase-binding regulatory protein [Aquirhabdus sp.]|uniref:Spx/MgsR family RNA polymerase-binding regulatory protein n=1 Tax=Aquirhabdus sp. TaxID=2824160 RepID=UPI00396C7565
MYTIYGIKSCNTMKKAFTLLDELGVPYSFHDYKKSGIDAATLETWIDHIGLDTLINRKGTTWRALSETDQAAANTRAGAIQLMQNKTSVIKRPILVGDHDGKAVVICGLQEDQYRQLAEAV